MNDLKKIYIELEKRWIELTGLQQGDAVKVIRKASHHEMGWNDIWIERYMFENEIHSFQGPVSDGKGIKLSNGFCYPYFVLEPVKTTKESIMRFTDPHNGNTRSAVITEDGIKCGCIDLAYKDVLVILSRIKEIRDVLGAGNTVSLLIDNYKVELKDIQEIHDTIYEFNR